MDEPYYISYGDMMFHGVTVNGNPIWTLDLEDAMWLSADEANRWVRALQILSMISGLEVKRV